MRQTVVVLVMTMCFGVSTTVSGTPAPGPKEYRFDGGTLGPVSVYAPDGIPGSVVLFVSGTEGWDSRMVDMARQLQSWGALVAGIDVRRSLQASVPSGATEHLGHVLEKRAGLGTYRAPFLVGYSSGGVLAHSIVGVYPRIVFDAIERAEKLHAPSRLIRTW